MSRDKQIEMHELAKQMSEAISTAVEQRYIEDEAKLEAVLRANGWRKAPEVIEDLFEEFEALVTQKDMPITTMALLATKEYADFKKKWVKL
jgi:hypothetical protein